MSQELIVKPRTEVAVQSAKKDILYLYGVPEMLDQIVKKEKIDLFNKISCGAVILDSLNKLSHSEDFIVEIPSGLREMLRSGKATFDKSAKNPGGFTPNIRIKGDSGIKGQATIVQKADYQAVTQSISNLAMLALVQSVLEKMDVIDEKLEDIKKGQQNDRIGTIIGSFKGFMDLYPNFTSDRLNYTADSAYLDMQKGLAQLHLEMDEERKKLDKAPKNWFESIWNGIKHPSYNYSGRCQNTFRRYAYNIQLYNRLILLSDVILHLMGDDQAIAKNHRIMVEYCNNNMNGLFIKNMNFLMAGDISDINNIHTYNKNLESALLEFQIKDIRIECKKEDIKYLKFKEDESKDC